MFWPGKCGFCAGQSNMQMTVEKADGAEKEIASAKYPMIRCFIAQRETSPFPQDNIRGNWFQCAPSTVKNFSAAGYFFAREINARLNVPVGIIVSAWGATRIEPWTAPEGFAAVPQFVSGGRTINYAALYKNSVPSYLSKLEKWIQDARAAAAKKEALAEAAPVFGNSEPCAIFNCMIYPFAGFAIRGALWYQGESNKADRSSYYYKMEALIKGWRQIWGQGNFPFYYTQIAPFAHNTADAIPELWEAQTEALNIPNTGMAVTNDIGDIADIHPKKQTGSRKMFSLNSPCEKLRLQ